MPVVAMETWRLCLSALIVVLSVRTVVGRGVVNVTSCTCRMTDGVCTVKEKSREFNTSYSYQLEPQKLIVLSSATGGSTVIDMSWLGPAGGLSSLTGFAVNLQMLNFNQVLHIPVENLTSYDSEKVRWRVQCVTSDAVYRNSVEITTFSLPLPTGEGQLRNPIAVLTFPSLAAMRNSSALFWTPAVTTSSSKHKIRVQFPFPESLSSEIHYFQIGLVHSPLKQAYPREDGSVSTEFSSSESQASTCLTVTIKKIFKDQGCDAFSYRVDGECRIPPEITATMSLAGSCLPAILTVVPGTSTTKAHVLTLPSKDDTSSHQMLPLISIPLTLLLVIVIIGAALVLRRNHKETPPVSVPTSPPSPSISGSPTSPSSLSDIAVDFREREEVPLHSKRVLLIYSDDHKAHMNVIHKFATFLEEECCCTVFFDEWSMSEASCNILTWHLHKLEIVDKVIIIHSEGAFFKHKAHLANEIVIDKNPCLKGDTFTNIFPTLLNKITLDPYYPCIMVHFSYTRSKFLISDIIKGFEYKLPDNIEHFMLHLHDSSKYEFKREHSIPLINGKEYHKTPSGKKLKDAIYKAQEYDAKHPNWCRERYRRANILDVEKSEAAHPGDDLCGRCSSGDDVSIVDSSSTYSYTAGIPRPRLEPPSEVHSMDDISFFVENPRSQHELFPPDDSGELRSGAKEAWAHGLQSIGNDSQKEFIEKNRAHSADDIPFLMGNPRLQQEFCPHDGSHNLLVETKKVQPHGLQSIGNDSQEEFFDSGFGQVRSGLQLPDDMVWDLSYVNGKANSNEEQINMNQFDFCGPESISTSGFPSFEDLPELDQNEPGTCGPGIPEPRQFDSGHDDPCTTSPLNAGLGAVKDHETDGGKIGPDTGHRFPLPVEVTDPRSHVQMWFSQTPMDDISDD